MTPGSNNGPREHSPRPDAEGRNDKEGNAPPWAVDAVHDAAIARMHDLGLDRSERAAPAGSEGPPVDWDSLPTRLGPTDVLDTMTLNTGRTMVRMFLAKDIGIILSDKDALTRVRDKLVALGDTLNAMRSRGSVISDRAFGQIRQSIALIQDALRARPAPTPHRPLASPDSKTSRSAHNKKEEPRDAGEEASAAIDKNIPDLGHRVRDLGEMNTVQLDQLHDKEAAKLERHIRRISREQSADDARQST